MDSSQQIIITPSSGINEEDLSTLNQIENKQDIENNQLECEIYISPIPPHMPPRKLENILRNHNIDFIEVTKKIIGKTFGFISFVSELQRSNAIPLLRKVSLYNNVNLTPKETKSNIIKKLSKKRLKKDEEQKTKKRKIPIEKNISLVDKVLPLWNIPYTEQLLLKERIVLNSLDRVSSKLKKEYPNKVWPWTEGKTICEFNGITPSPQQKYYRNKSEFTIGLNFQHQPTVGWNLSSYEDGHSNFISEPDKNCINIHPIHRELAILMTKYLRNPENLWPIYDRNDQTGVWRLLTIRTSTRTKQLMIYVQISLDGEYSEDFRNMSNSLFGFINTILNSENFQFYNQFKLVCFAFQLAERKISNPDPNPNQIKIIYGTDSIIENLCGLSFYITPSTFFQTNTESAEIIYDIVTEWSGCNSSSTLIDVCCGTGTIGLVISKRTKCSLVGIELNPASVECAIKNAEKNEVPNTEFICGKAEDVLGRILHIELLKKEKSNKFVAVVDPPRGGLHPKSLLSLRNCYAITKLVYVSCNPQSLSKDLISLIRPPSNKRPSIPFTIVKCIGVDQFPSTNHCEVICLLIRKPFKPN